VGACRLRPFSFAFPRGCCHARWLRYTTGASHCRTERRLYHRSISPKTSGVYGVPHNAFTCLPPVPSGTAALNGLAA